MSAQIITPSTTRQFVELAMSRIVDNRLKQPGATWQYVMRFFRGELDTARVIYKVEQTRIAFRDESNNPAMMEVDLMIRVSSQMHDGENSDVNGNNSEHDQVAANFLGLIFDADALRAAMNAAMNDDYGNVFYVVLCQPDGEARTSVEKERQTTEIKVTVILQPPEIALALAAANPVSG
jgi:hypothetical protein